MKMVTLNRELLKLAQKKARSPKMGDFPGAEMAVRLFVENELTFACHVEPGQKVKPIFEIFQQLEDESVITMPATVRTAEALEKAAALIRAFDAAAAKAGEDARRARKSAKGKQPARPAPAAPKKAQAAPKAAAKRKGKAA